MNNDLISREALKKAILEHRNDYVDDNCFWTKLFNLIENAPTVPIYEHERLKAEWIKNGAYYDERAKAMFYKCKCSICGITQSFYEDDETGELFSFLFCPNCGADMKGEVK